MIRFRNSGKELTCVDVFRSLKLRKIVTLQLRLLLFRFGLLHLLCIFLKLLSQLLFSLHNLVQDVFLDLVRNHQLCSHPLADPSVNLQLGVDSLLLSL